MRTDNTRPRRGHEEVAVTIVEWARGEARRGSMDEGEDRDGKAGGAVVGGRSVSISILESVGGGGGRGGGLHRGLGALGRTRALG